MRLAGVECGLRRLGAPLAIWHGEVSPQEWAAAVRAVGPVATPADGGFPIRGRVVDELDRPIEGAAVELRPRAPTVIEPGATGLAAPSAADGAFELRAPSPGFFTVAIGAAWSGHSSMKMKWPGCLRSSNRS